MGEFVSLTNEELFNVDGGSIEVVFLGVTFTGAAAALPIALAAMVLIDVAVIGFMVGASD